MSTIYLILPFVSVQLINCKNNNEQPTSSLRHNGNKSAIFWGGERGDNGSVIFIELVKSSSANHRQFDNHISERFSPPHSHTLHTMIPCRIESNLIDFMVYLAEKKMCLLLLCAPWRERRRVSNFEVGITCVKKSVMQSHCTAGKADTDTI
jgi:hypothetical protein